MTGHILSHCGETRLLLEGCELVASGNELEARDLQTQAVRFRLRLDHPTIEALRNLAIVSLCATPDGKGVFVLLAPASRGYRNVGNLLRIDLDGSIIWWVEEPRHGTDNYTSIQVKNGRLYAYSWDGFSSWIDEHSGRIVERKFVK